jgi:branched-chain amino acid transport system ATP-binding protein
VSDQSEALLEVRSVSVRFGGLQALSDVELQLQPGKVTGLIGPNGAGKTTLFNVICGLQDASGGVFLKGHDVTALPAFRRVHLGIARTFQRLELFGSLSVRDNIRVAAEMERRWSRRRLAAGRRATGQESGATADEVIDVLGLGPVANQLAGGLPTGLARLVELGRALAARPLLLLLDEPSSGLDEHESLNFARLLSEFADQGLGILLVEHDMDLVMKVCSTIHVLDFGTILAVGTPAEIQGNPAVQEAYLGSHAAAVATQ